MARRSRGAIAAMLRGHLRSVKEYWLAEFLSIHLVFVDHSSMRTVLGVKDLVAKIFGAGPHVEEDAIAELAQE